MKEPKRWVNSRGKVRWQPVTQSGKYQWKERFAVNVFVPEYQWSAKPPYGATGESFIGYASRKRAIRVGARQDRKEANNTWKQEA